jgi:glycerol-3-phosphate acyltransferase PlsY
MYLFIIIFLISYLIGSIPFGLILVKLAGKGDIRTIGSGNIGATNVLRTGSKKLAALTLLLDGGKGFFASIFGLFIIGFHNYNVLVVAAPILIFIPAFGVLLGHMFPVWLRFRGGKGVATALGIFFAIDWRIGIVACVVWLLAAFLFRYSSLAAILAMISAPAATSWFLELDLGRSPDFYRVVILPLGLMSILVILRHHANIRRLLNRTEPKIGKSVAS